MTRAFDIIMKVLIVKNASSLLDSIAIPHKKSSKLLSELARPPNVDSL